MSCTPWMVWFWWLCLTVVQNELQVLKSKPWRIFGEPIETLRFAGWQHVFFFLSNMWGFLMWVPKHTNHRAAHGRNRSKQLEVARQHRNHFFLIIHFIWADLPQKERQRPYTSNRLSFLLQVRPLSGTQTFSSPSVGSPMFGRTKALPLCAISFTRISSLQRLREIKSFNRWRFTWRPGTSSRNCVGYCWVQSAQHPYTTEEPMCMLRACTNSPDNTLRTYKFWV